MSLKHSQLFIATDSVIELKDLVDQDDAPVTDATVEMTALTDADGDAAQLRRDVSRRAAGRARRGSWHGI